MTWTATASATWANQHSTAGKFRIVQTAEQTFTDANGDFRLSNLVVGTNYTVTPDLPLDWQVTTGSTVINSTGVDFIEIGIGNPVRIQGASSISEGSLAQFNAIDSGTNPSYSWSVTRNGANYIGGGQSSVGTAFSFTPEDDGDYVVAVSVTDDGPIVIENFAELLVTNLPPNVDIGPDLVRPEGTPLGLTATVNDPGVNDVIASYLWQVTDEFGNVVATSVESAFDAAIADEGLYTVTLVVTDDAGASSTDHLTLTIDNAFVAISFDPPPSNLQSGVAALQAPVVGVRRVALNEQLVISGSFVDSGNDFWTGTIDFGDGTIQPLVIDNVNKTFSAQYAYQSAGKFLVTVTIDDSDGWCPGGRVGCSWSESPKSPACLSEAASGTLAS